jgi:hypothetical protein
MSIQGATAMRALLVVDVQKGLMKRKLFEQDAFLCWSSDAKEKIAKVEKELVELGVDTVSAEEC